MKKKKGKKNKKKNGRKLTLFNPRCYVGLPFYSSLPFINLLKNPFVVQLILFSINLSTYFDLCYTGVTKIVGS